MFQPLDGPAVHGTITLTTSTVQLFKVGASPLTDRAVITIQPQDGVVRLFFGDGSTTPSAATVLAQGFSLTKNGLYSFEASDKQQVWLLSNLGTVIANIAERA
jgi:hypothetical protein